MQLFDGTDDRLARLETRVDRALLRLGVAPDEVDVRPALSEQVMYWVSRGSLIHAIREYREETGAGLVGFGFEQVLLPQSCQQEVEFALQTLQGRSDAHPLHRVL